jgi:cytochrome P450
VSADDGATAASTPHGLPRERDAGPFDPPRRVTELRESRPVSPLVFPDGHVGWLVTGYDAVRQLMSDTRFSSCQDIGTFHMPYEVPGMPVVTEPSPPPPGIFIAMDPPEHTWLRQKVAGAFTARRMRTLTEHITGIARRTVDEMVRATPPVDLVPAFALPVSSLVICELLGVPDDDRDRFQADSVRFLDQELSFDEQMAAYASMSAHLADLVARKRADPGDDILSDLARHDDLTLDDLTGMAFVLLLAGQGTSADVLALGTFALLEHPAQLAALRDDPTLVPGAVEELLRHLSVVDILFRYATEDIELGGETIGRGSTVVVSLLAADHDPRRFPDADRLDVRRTARGHLSFGHGVHQCLGQELARIEMRAGFDALLRAVPDLELAVPADEVRLKTHMRIYGVHELPVRWAGGGTA